MGLSSRRLGQLDLCRERHFYMTAPNPRLAHRIVQLASSPATSVAVANQLAAELLEAEASQPPEQLRGSQPAIHRVWEACRSAAHLLNEARQLHDAAEDFADARCHLVSICG